MAALRARPLRALVFARGLSADAATRLGGPGLRFETQPLHMGQVLAEADLVISHGSLGTVTAAALAGKPQLAMPNHMEQHMVSRRIVQAGIGLAVLPRSQGNAYADLLATLLDRPAHADSARALATRLAGYTLANAGQRLISLLESSAAGPAAPTAPAGAAH